MTKAKNLHGQNSKFIPVFNSKRGKSWEILASEIFFEETCAYFLRLFGFLNMGKNCNVLLLLDPIQAIVADIVADWASQIPVLRV